jgi:hypothetical protein
MGFKLEKQLLTQRIEEKKALYLQLNDFLKREFANSKAAQSSLSQEERPELQMSPQGATAIESTSFNNQIENKSGVILDGSVLQMPMNPWGMVPMMGYHPSGLFYWYT